MQTLRIAFRTLARTPLISVVAALSLALGIGANAAIYSTFDQILRRPLPVPRAQELVNLSAPGPKPGSQTCNDAGNCEAVFSYPMFRDLERQVARRTPLVGIAAHRSFTANLGYSGNTVSAQAVMVSGGYFSLLGLVPAQGRLLTPADDETIGAHPVAVVSYTFWTNTLGGGDVTNRKLSINGVPFTIVGVAPKGFEGTTIGVRPKLYVPISMRAAIQRAFRGFEVRTSYWVYAFGRLRPGATVEELGAPLTALYHPIVREVEAPLQTGMSAETMERFRNKPIVVEDGRRGQSSVQDGARTPILLLFAVTGIVLLIACANIANLLFARATNRALEMAVRLSLGARRSQLLRQLLTESVLLATIGGVASLVVAHWTLGGINSIMPAEIADTMAFHVDRAAITFAAIASVATGLLVGLFPALQSTRPDMVSALRTGSVKLAGTRGASRVRTTLATAQIALSMALLIGAGLFVKSLWLMSRVDLGVDVERLVTFELVPTRNGYAPLRSRQLFDRVEAELRRVPGVTGVTSAAVPIIAGNNWNEIVSVQGFAKGPDTDAESSMNIIGANFFSVTGIPVLAGRDFTATDRVGTAKVAIVNEAFARKFGLGRDAVGKLMSRGSDSLDLTIVGLVKDSPYSEVRDVIPPVFYTPAMQDTTLGAISFYARTDGDLGAVTAAIPSIIKSLDATLPVEELKSMPQQIRENVFVDRIISILSATFAALATVLAAIGLYGVLAYAVAQRTKEIGVRMALGADPRRVRRMVLRQVGMMTLVGGVIGVLGAIGLGKGASSILYQVSSFDLGVSIAAAVILTAVAFAAGYAPALRASRIDPMQALRYE